MSPASPLKWSEAEWREQRVEWVKTEASRRIEAVYPLWKQVNILRDGTADEIQAMRVAINAVRNKSDVLEALVATMTIDELKALRVNDEAYWD